MPNLIIIFEIDGIYVCPFGTSYLWTWLEVLKSYLDSNEIAYSITDYQE